VVLTDSVCGGVGGTERLCVGRLCMCWCVCVFVGVGRQGT
jgi:hypothetical protein